MPIDVIETPETGDQGIGRFLGELTRNEGEGHGSAMDISIVEFNLRDVLNPSTGLVYHANEDYVTGGIDITALVADTRHCRFKRILSVIPQPWDSDNAWVADYNLAISFPNNQFIVHRPATGDIMLKLYVQTGTITEPLAELGNGVAMADQTVRCTVMGVRGNNSVATAPPS